jgi:hypothetical protein
MAEEKDTELKPGQVKPRLPFEQKAQAESANMRQRMWAFIFAVVALGLCGMAYYMHVIRGVGLMQPQVLFPSLGAVWFFIRAFLSFLPKRSG